MGSSGIYCHYCCLIGSIVFYTIIILSSLATIVYRHPELCTITRCRCNSHVLDSSGLFVLRTNVREKCIRAHGHLLQCTAYDTLMGGGGGGKGGQ